MPTPLENELGLGPVMHRVRRWSQRVVSRVGRGSTPADERLLDPLTVNYAAWREMRRTVREWPQYKEAANSIEVLVSPEDWDEYWGIDASRKEASVATYVRARAAEKGYWMAGDPQVMVIADDAIDPGEVEIVCQFVEPLEEEEHSFASSTAQQPAITTDLSNAAGATGVVSGDARVQADVSAQPTLRFVDAREAGEAYLSDDTGFKLTIESGDIIGVVEKDGYAPNEVNVRLDGEGFPYVESKQCQLGVLGGRWTITNFAERGTKLITADGTRLMLSISEPYPLGEGDVVYLGPERPLRFSLS